MTILPATKLGTVFRTMPKRTISSTTPSSSPTFMTTQDASSGVDAVLLPASTTRVPRSLTTREGRDHRKESTTAVTLPPRGYDAVEANYSFSGTMSSTTRSSTSLGSRTGTPAPTSSGAITASSSPLGGGSGGEDDAVLVDQQDFFCGFMDRYQQREEHQGEHDTKTSAHDDAGETAAASGGLVPHKSAVNTAYVQPNEDGGVPPPSSGRSLRRKRARQEELSPGTDDVLGDDHNVFV